jgi:RimJ/RimL family protein N-acetyltransferase
MSSSLFDGQLVYLGAYDPEKDAATESKWTHDPDYLMADWEPARPLSPFQIKKKYEEMEKEHHGSRYYFGIRTRADERLVGLASLQWIEWNHGTAAMRLIIGSPEDRGKGYGSDALRLLLRYAFAELNLHRLTAFGFEYCPRGIAFLERAGFVMEVRRREAIQRGGRRWDSFTLGLLRSEWEEQHAKVDAIAVESR